MKRLRNRKKCDFPCARIVQRRARVAAFYARGMTIAEMARKLAVSSVTINADLRAIKADWHDTTMHQYHITKIRELDRLDRIEAAAWQGWERSQTDEETTRVTTDGQKQKAEKVSKKQAGDPRFLDRINWCINKRCHILGLDKPNSTPDASAETNDLSLEERRNQLAALLDRLREYNGTESDRPAAADTDAET